MPILQQSITGLGDDFITNLIVVVMSYVSRKTRLNSVSQAVSLSVHSVSQSASQLVSWPIY